MIIMTSVVSQQSWSGEALSALQRLGGIPPEAIWGHNINRLSNILTMGYGLWATSRISEASLVAEASLGEG